MVVFENIEVKILLKVLTQIWDNVICGSKLRQNRFFRFYSKVTIISSSKLKLDIVHLKTCITVLCHHSQTLTFWEWSRDRIWKHAGKVKVKGVFEIQITTIFWLAELEISSVSGKMKLVAVPIIFWWCVGYVLSKSLT